MNNSKVSAVHPSGKYYVGDLCYAITPKLYESVWGKNDYKPGTYEVVVGEKKLSFSVNSTAWGDGCFCDSVSGNEFSVDAGVISIVPYELCDKKAIKNGTINGGHFIESTSSIQFESSQGIFVIEYNKTDLRADMIIIDTMSMDSDDEDEYEDDKE